MLTISQRNRIREYITESGATIDRTFPTQESKLAFTQMLSGIVAGAIPLPQRDLLNGMLNMLSYFVAREIIATDELE